MKTVLLALVCFLFLFLLFTYSLLLIKDSIAPSYSVFAIRYFYLLKAFIKTGCGLSTYPNFKHSTVPWRLLLYFPKKNRLGNCILRSVSDHNGNSVFLRYRRISLPGVFHHNPPTLQISPTRHLHHRRRLVQLPVTTLHLSTTATAIQTTEQLLLQQLLRANLLQHNL